MAAEPEERTYADHIAAVRTTELPLSSATEVYLDAAATPRAARSVLAAVHEHQLRATAAISNPHSHSPSGRWTRDQIDKARTFVCKELFGVARRGGIVSNDDDAGQSNDGGWELIFNSGATAGLESVAQSFNWQTRQAARSRFAYFEQSHTSLYGLRDVAKAHGASVDCLSDEDAIITWTQQQAEQSYPCLLAIPLQCNATGRRYFRLLERVLQTRRRIEQGGHRRSVFILLDAAAYLSPSSRLSMNGDDPHQADFVVFSFIKIIGYPSGLGGLLLQRNSYSVLKAKAYYGGGTLEATTSRTHWRKPTREISEALEAGTPDIYGILSLEPAMTALRSPKLLQSWEQAARHTEGLTRNLHHSLRQLRHGDGSPLIELYSSNIDQEVFNNGRSQAEDLGPTVLFNVLRAQSSIPDADLRARRVDPDEVDRLACVEDIHLRAGRMCNVGAVAAALGVCDDDIVALWERGIGCGTASGRRSTSKQDAMDPQEEARLQALVSGALRVSLSAWNIREDVDRLCEFLDKHFSLREAISSEPQTVFEEECDDFVSCTNDDGQSMKSESESESESQVSLCTSVLPSDTQASSQTSHSIVASQEPNVDMSGSHYLREVYIYPIKSCAAQRIRGPWRIKDTGLEHDRGMCVVDLDTGKILSQKRIPAMARIRPHIQPGARDVQIHFVDVAGSVVDSLTVPLAAKETEEALEAKSGRAFDMCGSSLLPVPITSKEVCTAFSLFLGRNCTLARMPQSTTRAANASLPLLLSNESPYLMVTLESIEQVHKWMQDDEGFTSDTAHVGLAFRANFVLSATTLHKQSANDVAPFYEDEASQVTLGPHAFTVLGPCRRCEMIALDPMTGKPVPQLIKAVAHHRRCTHGRLRGRLLFGQHLLLRHDDCAGANPSADALYVKEGMAVGLYP